MAEEKGHLVSREIKGSKLITFNLVSFGGLLITTYYNSYAFYYYVYVVRLDALLVSIGTMIGMMTIAFGSPIMGIISDNQPVGKHGKRKPFFLYGLPLMALGSILTWYPPSMCLPAEPVNWVTTLYFWAMSFIMYLGTTIIGAPYLGMIPEQSETEANRLEVSKVQGLFNLIAMVLGIMLPIIVQSTLEDPENVQWYNPSGQILITIVPLLAILITAIGSIFTLATYFTVDESFLQSPAEKKSVKRAVVQMFRPVKQPNPRNFFMTNLSMQTGAKILLALPIPFLTYVAGVGGLTFIVYLGLILITEFVALFVWDKIIPKTGVIKANTMGFALITVPLLCMLVLFTGISGVAMLIFIMADFLVVAFGLIVSFLTPIPILSSIIEEAAGNGTVDARKKEAESGLYFGLYTFFTYAGVALGGIVMGICLSGGQEENPFVLTVMLPISGIIYALALIYNRKLALPALSKGSK
nr:MFS transporter [Candidatus Sigynarchaeota archaeon]